MPTQAARTLDWSHSFDAKLPEIRGSVEVYHDETHSYGVFKAPTKRGEMTITVEVPRLPILAQVVQELQKRFPMMPEFDAVAGWGFSSLWHGASHLADQAADMSKMIASRRALREIQEIVNNPDVVKGIGVASMVYPPLGVSYATVRSSMALLDKVSAGDPVAVSKVVDIHASASQGDPAHQHALEVLRKINALQKVVKAGGVEGTVSGMDQIEMMCDPSGCWIPDPHAAAAQIGAQRTYVRQHAPVRPAPQVVQARPGAGAPPRVTAPMRSPVAALKSQMMAAQAQAAQQDAYPPWDPSQGYGDPSQQGGGYDPYAQQGGGYDPYAQQGGYDQGGAGGWYGDGWGGQTSGAFTDRAKKLEAKWDAFLDKGRLAREARHKAAKAKAARK